MSGAYPPRPAPAPTLASLVAAGILQPHHRVLDVGCGTGTDAVALATWGLRRVIGLDRRAGAIAAARRRARAKRVQRRVRFEVGDALALSETFGERSFDAVLDVLMVNNLRDEELKRYCQEVARVLSPGGLLVMHCRVLRVDFEDRRGPLRPPRALRRWVAFGPVVPAVLPEAPPARGPPFARTSLWIGRRNDRPA